MHFSEVLFPGAHHLWKRHEWNLVFHLAGACILGSTGVSMEAILKLFGECFFKFCKMSGYDRMLRTLGGNLTEFTENLDALHSSLAHSYQVSPSGSELSGPERKQVLLVVLGHLATSPKRLQLPGACGILGTWHQWGVFWGHKWKMKTCWLLL